LVLGFKRGGVFRGNSGDVAVKRKYQVSH